MPDEDDKDLYNGVLLGEHLGPARLGHEGREPAGQEHRRRRVPIWKVHFAHSRRELSTIALACHAIELARMVDPDGLRRTRPEHQGEVDVGFEVVCCVTQWFNL